MKTLFKPTKACLYFPGRAPHIFLHDYMHYSIEEITDFNNHKCFDIINRAKAWWQYAEFENDYNEWRARTV
jgi:hypothetical protein